METRVAEQCACRPTPHMIQFNSVISGTSVADQCTCVPDTI